MSNRKSIVDNIKTTLRTIIKSDQVTLNNGTIYTYNRTFRRVSDNLVALEEASEYMPAVFITIGDSTEAQQHGKMYKVELDVLLTIYAKQEENLVELMSDLYEDVITAMMQDMKRGGFAVMTQHERTLLDIVSFKPMSIMEMFYTITYFQQT